MAKFTSEGLARIHAGVERHIAEGYVPGAVGLVACGDEIETLAVGTKEVGGSEPVARDTIFRIASMTKPIAATAVMMLIDDGKVRLDEPVDRLLPELANRRVLRSLDAEIGDTVPATRPITIKDLLTYQMGLGVILARPGTYPIQRAIAELGITIGMPDPAMPFDNDEWLRRIGTLPLMAQPGEDWLYTTGSNVQTVLVARVTGQSLGAFLEERLFDPLGMVDTGFYVPPEKRHRFISANRMIDGKLVAFDSPVDGNWTKPPIFEAGDSGLVSTVDDYYKFARMLLDEGRHKERALLSPAAFDAMTTNYLTPAQRAAAEVFLGPARGWGLGVAVAVEKDATGSSPGALSWSGGFGTSWISDRAIGLTMILMTSRLADAPGPRPISAEFQVDAYKALA